MSMKYEDFKSYRCGEKVYTQGILCNFIRRGTFSSQKGRIMVIGVNSEYTAWVEPERCRPYAWWKPIASKIIDAIQRWKRGK